MTKTFLLTLGLAAALPGVMIAGTAIAGDDPPVAKTTAAPADDPAPAAPSAPEVTDKAALADDILAIIALPLVADDAREAGVDAADIVLAIDAVDASGGSPADASAVIAAEADATRKRGPKKGFGLWVRTHVADGKRGEELAALIAKKKAEYTELSDADRVEIDARIDAKLATMHDTWVEHRKQLNERRRELVAKGKKAVRKGQADLATLEQKIAKSDARKKRLAEAIATDPARKAAWEKMLKKVDKRVEKLEEIAERTEDRVEGAEDRLDAAEDRKEKRDEKRDEIRTKIQEKKAERDAEGKGG